VQTSSEVHPASYSWGNMGLMAKQQGYEVKHLPPPSTQVMSMWRYTSTHHSSL